MSASSRPDPSEFAPFYAAYVDEVPDGDILDHLAVQGRATGALLAAVDDKSALHRYAAGKWSVKEIVGHLIDSERVFAYRALTAARGDRTSLPGFDHDVYIAGGDFDQRPVADLVAELDIVRSATVALFGGLADDAWSRRGIANGSEITPRALAWIIAGHERHHVRVLGERYGLGTP